MTIGNGDIASILPEDETKLFFASGVSNSQCTDQKEYDREKTLLLAQDRLAHLVYFSSLSIFYLDSHYTRHKRQMEKVIRQFFPNYTIIRIGNIDWGTNPHTLINFLRANPDAEIRDEYRYVIDQEEFLHWISLIPDWNVEMNCPGRRMKVKDIKEQYA